MKAFYDCCNDERLAHLLAEEQQTVEFRLASEHIQTCERCQKRLSALAADGETWNEIKLLLSDADDLEAAFDAPLTALAPPRHPELLGRLGRYDVEGVIGSGGMGVVLKGHDAELNRPVAIKLLARHLAHNGAARQRFAREARAAAAVVDEHVVAIHSIESDAETPFLVMQYVAGESLQTRVAAHGPLGVLEALRIGVQAAAGLAAAHAQGVVHRDVKPANILLEPGVDRALLTDFGLARVVDDATMTRTGIVAGTPEYMSPEQASGEAVDHRSDLFSLGSVLYFMLTGRPPFRAAHPLAVLLRICRDRHRPLWESLPAAPDELSDVVDRLLEKKPGRRYATADETRAALAAVLTSLQEGNTRNRSLRRLRRHKRAVLVAACSLIAVLGGAAVKLAQQGGAAAPTAERPAAESPARPLAPAIASVQSPDIGATSMQAFAAELAEVQGLLEQTQNQPMLRVPPGLAAGDEAWEAELRAINRGLSVDEAVLNNSIPSEVKP